MVCAEPLETLIDPSAEIYGYEGSRDLITIITDGEKDPLVMGFKLASDEPPVPAERDEHAMDEIDVAPEDEIVGLDIDGNSDAQGAEITQQGRLVVVPSPTDKVLVDGVELTAESSLQALRTALSTGGRYMTYLTFNVILEPVFGSQQAHCFRIL